MDLIRLMSLQRQLEERYSQVPDVTVSPSVHSQNSDNSEDLERLSRLLISRVISTIAPGHLIQVKFKGGEAGLTAYSLLKLHHYQSLSVEPESYKRLEVIREGERWGSSGNRVFRFQATEKWRRRLFRNWLESRIEEISILK